MEDTMIANVQEVVEKYKMARKSYLDQHAKMTKIAKQKKAGDLSLPAGFYECEIRGRQVEGMAEVLGLSNEEKVAIDKECSVENTGETAVTS